MEISTNEQQQAAAPSKAKQIVSMCLSAAGLGMVAVSTVSSAASGGIGIAFSSEALALSIVGYIMSRKGLKTGTDSKFLRLGKNLGLAGIISSAATLAVSILVLLVILAMYILFAAIGASAEISQYL